MKQTLEFSDPFSEIRPANLTNHMCLLTERYNNVCTRLKCSHLHVTKRYELLGVAHTKKNKSKLPFHNFSVVKIIRLQCLEQTLMSLNQYITKR